MSVDENVFNSDNPITICDRILKKKITIYEYENVQLSQIFVSKIHRKKLRDIVEESLNSKIESMCQQVDQIRREDAKRERDNEQRLRERRLRSAMNTNGNIAGYDTNTN